MEKKSQSRYLKAFSLIELSIVVLIVGIVVAGVTQSSRMINAMRLSSARAQTQSSPVNSITDLVIWLDAASEKSFLNQSSNASIDNGDTVKTWYDISPFVTDRKFITQATTGYQPQYVSTGLNNLPVVRYAVTNDNMRMTGTLPAGYRPAMTLFIVYKYGGTYNANGNTNMVEFSDGTTSYSDSFEPSGYRHFVYNGVQIDNEAYQTITSSRAIVSTKIYNPTTNASTHYINGTSSATSTATNTRTWDAVTFIVGNHSVAPRTFGGDIAEIIVYDRALKT